MDENNFDRVYFRLALTGQADEPGSAEYKRIFWEWKLWGEDDALTDFIRRRANDLVPADLVLNLPDPQVRKGN